jgi:uncharacterized membrane-anchored protein
LDLLQLLGAGVLRDISCFALFEVWKAAAILLLGTLISIIVVGLSNLDNSKSSHWRVHEEISVENKRRLFHCIIVIANSVATYSVLFFGTGILPERLRPQLNSETSVGGILGAAIMYCLCVVIRELVHVRLAF